MGGLDEGDEARLKVFGDCVGNLLTPVHHSLAQRTCTRRPCSSTSTCSIEMRLHFAPVVLYVSGLLDPQLGHGRGLGLGLGLGLGDLRRGLAVGVVLDRPRLPLVLVSTDLTGLAHGLSIARQARCA